MSKILFSIDSFRLIQRQLGFTDDELLPQEFVVRLDLPDSLRGIFYIAKALDLLRSELGSEFENFFHISEKAETALNATIGGLLEKHPHLRNSQKQNGWCENQPIYALVFELAASVKIKSSTENIRLVKLFLEHYWNNQERIDAEFTSTSSKLREASGALRLLLQNDNEFDSAPFVRFESAQAIGERLEEFLETSESLQLKTQNYIRQLAHFFLLNWKGKEIKKRRYAPRRNFGKRNFDLSYPVPNEPLLRMHKREPAVQQAIEESGLLPDDLSLDIDVLEERPEPAQKRPKFRVQKIHTVLDSQQKLLRVFDISQRLQRAHNGHALDKHVIQPYEILALFNRLKSINYSELNITELSALICCWGLLVTGRSLSEFLSMRFNDLGKEGVFCEEDLTYWWCFNIPAATKEQRNATTVISCPKDIVTLLKLLHPGGAKAKPQQLIPESIKEIDLDKEFIRFFKGLYKKTRITLSIEKLKNFCLHRMISKGQQDPIFLLFAFGDYSYQTRVTRFYSKTTTTEIAEQLNTFWRDVLSDLRMIEPDIQLPEGLINFEAKEDKALGSNSVPVNEELLKLTTDLCQKLSLFKRLELQMYVHKLIEYHNNYVLYTSVMLLQGTGYRAVKNPLPIFTFFLPEYHAMVISDKDDEDFTNTRIVAVAPVLEEQLLNYQHHVLHLRHHLALIQPELSEHINQAFNKLQTSFLNTMTQNHSLIGQIKNNDRLPGPLFHLSLRLNHIQFHAITPKWLKSQLFQFDYPINFGRHILRTHLLKQSAPPELINFQMGHWSTGEAALGDYSSFEISEAIALLRPVINIMLKDQGWRPQPTLLA
ncbi:MAG: hypothetical protein PHE38_09470 [Alishewanella agri]|nr:hypothetical protein [Alishewanella agri]